MIISDCCSAKVYAPTNDWAICLDCKEHCDVVENSPQEKLIIHRTEKGEL